MDAVKATAEIDHGESIAHEEDLKVGADVRRLREAASYAYLKDVFDDDRLDDIEFSTKVTDEHLEQIRAEIDSLPETIDDDDLPDGFGVEDIEAVSDACEFTDEQLRTIIELETRIDDIRGSKEAELKLVKEGEVGHAAVAVLLVVAVVYVAVYNN